MQLRFYFFTIAFLLITLTGEGQTDYPKDYFRSPVDTTISLAGNFGEIRANHFHAGFDIRTNNHEGMRVYAAADGYVSRIKISPVGYGKALYITHPNGYTTVYGHLQSFNGNIGELTKASQYASQTFELDTLLASGLLPVKKGDLIGLSGNTGGSQGPHLHFEIRESIREIPINPYFFGFKIDDTIKPRVTELVIYPLSDNASINGKHLLKKIRPVYKKGKYSYLKTDTLAVNGEIGFGIECYDTETGSNNQNGVFSIELQSGGKRIYYHELEKFSFENARYVNAHIDYAEKQKHKDNIQKCFLAKNNQLGIYKDVVNNGRINFTDDSVHWIKYIVKDYNGNTTEMMLKVRSRSKALQIFPPLKNIFTLDCTKENVLNKEDLKLTIPEYAMYDDAELKYSKTPAPKGCYAPLFHIQNDEYALQKSIKLSILPKGLSEALQSKAVIISINEKGSRSYEGGKYNDGWVSTETKSFGNFTISVDTVAPKLKPAFKLSKDTSAVDLSKAKFIGVTAKDDLSGIKKYRATIDGQWVLCEYEMKQDLLFYSFDEHVQPGYHFFYIEVTDAKGNSSNLSCRFKR